MWQRWCLAVGSMLAATSARAASIEIRCPKLAESSKSELEARAQLLLSSAKMASITRSLDAQAARLPDYLVRKHFERKHGKRAYYGQ